MYRFMCKSKIHRAKVTETNLTYEGSVTIDQELMEKADIISGERVQIVNLNNGVRVETYVIEGKRNSGTICMNGAAARWAEPDDIVIFISYVMLEDNIAKNHRLKTVYVDNNNKVTKVV
ncbi:MAG: aspartate 1-decarboxylase [bacterium]|nr:aspartate 1-decarboxylase [bacterium]